MSCSTGLHNAIKKILNKKPWYRYIIQGNNGIIHLLNNSKANINYYTSYDAAVVIAAHINDSINNGEKIIGDIAFPKRDYTKRGIVVIEPLNAQLDLLNTEDSAEISRLQSKIQTESEIKEQEEKSINKEEDANILNNNIETIREWLKQGMEEDTFWQKVEELGVSKVQINTFKGVSNDLQTKEHSLNLSPKTEKKDSQTPTRNTQNIYPKLGNKTATGNVIIKSVYQQEGIQYAKSIGGVFSLRVNNSNKHFGNPFSSVQSEIDKGLTATKSTKESVEKYIDWVINSQDERAIWIRGLLKSGILKGKPILYYKELGEPSHATALDYLINKYDWNTKQPINKEIKPNEVKGIEINSYQTGLGNSLTNVHYAKNGKSAFDIVPSDKSLKLTKEAKNKWGESVEAWYKSNNAQTKGISEGEQGDKYDFDLMAGLITDKLTQYPNLVQQINERGGLTFLQKSTHTMGTGRWSSKNPKNMFINSLIQAYKNVVKQSETKDVYEALGFNFRYTSEKWKDDPTKENKATYINIKGTPSNQEFQIKKDLEDGFYSVHFKTEQGELTKEQIQTLVDAIASQIPIGGKLSTWGEITKGGISGLNRFLNNGFKKVGERKIKDKEGRPIVIPILEKVEKSNLEQQAQQLYSQYLEQNPNGSAEGFKKWVDNNQTNVQYQLPQERQQQIEKLFEENSELSSKIYEILGFRSTSPANAFKAHYGGEKRPLYDEYHSDINGNSILPQQKQQAIELYSQYLDTIFPDSKVKDIVYRGSQKEDTRLFQYWTKNETEAYMYAKANITKGGKITERNPIQVITNNFKKYIDDKYGENVFNSLNADESDYLTQISETEFDLQLPDWYRKNIKLDSEDESDFKSLQTLKELYDSIKIEDENDLDKPYTVDNYVALKKKYDLARKQLDKYFKREEVGKIETAILNIKNPYKEEIVQEDLQNDRDAYKNGHDGAFLMDGDHFFVKSNTEQIHILGSKQDIEGFKDFVDKDNSLSENEEIGVTSFEERQKERQVEQEDNTFQYRIPTREEIEECLKKPKAENGAKFSKFTKGSEWEVVSDLGAPSFTKGGEWRLEGAATHNTLGSDSPKIKAEKGIVISKFKPTKAKENSTSIYNAIPTAIDFDINSNNVDNIIADARRRKDVSLYDGNSYKTDYGQDESGEYISFYRKDGNTLTDLFGTSKEYYDRRYIEPRDILKLKTEGVTINDNRRINNLTGAPLKNNKKGVYGYPIIEQIIKAANKYEIDPYVAISMALQETNLGKTGAGVENPFHMNGGIKETPENLKRYAEYFKNMKKDKGDIIDRAMNMMKNVSYKDMPKNPGNYSDEIWRIQSHNGWGYITPNTEIEYDGGGDRYEMKIPKEGVSMKKNPIYGRFIKQLKDESIATNKDIQRLVEYFSKKQFKNN